MARVMAEMLASWIIDGEPPPIDLTPITLAEDAAGQDRNLYAAAWGRPHAWGMGNRMEGDALPASRPQPAPRRGDDCATGRDPVAFSESGRWLCREPAGE